VDPHTIADGCVSLGDKTLMVTRRGSRYRDRIEESPHAMRLTRKLKLVIEPSAALPLAVLRSAPVSRASA
jgi:hypothetical protein